MDKHTRVKIAINSICLFLSMIALYTFVATVEVSHGWRISLIMAMLDMCVANEKVHIIFCYMHPLI